MVSLRRHENGLAATGSAWLVLALSVASATARLEDEIPGVVVYREGSVGYKPGADGKGPWGEDLNDLAKTLSDNKTAWGSVAFDYPNLANNWLEVSDAPGWSWDITLQGDQELNAALKNGSAATLYGHEGVVSLQLPTSQNGSTLPVDEEWSLCLLHWDLANRRYNDRLRADDGTCSSALGEECRAALLRRVERAYAADGTCACTTAAAVPECAAEEAAGAAGPWDGGCVAEAVGARDMAGWAGGRRPVFGFAAGGFYDAGDLTVYRDLGSVAWPVLSVLAGTGGPASPGAGVAYIRSQLACVRPTRAAPGWEVPALPAAAPNTTAEADGPARTSAARGADAGSFGALLLALGCLATAFVI